MERLYIHSQWIFPNKITSLDSYLQGGVLTIYGLFAKWISKSNTRFKTTSERKIVVLMASTSHQS